MKLPVDEELKLIRTEILRRSSTPVEWVQIESDDELSTPPYEGVFEALVMAFCFSKYSTEQEWWFQTTIDDVVAIDRGGISEIEVRPAEIQTRRRR